MLKELTDKITYAVKVVYERTDIMYPIDSIAVKVVTITTPSLTTVCSEPVERTVGITRSTIKGDLYYKLYIPSFDEDNPFCTVFGCWPQEWVVDVFVRTLQHFYNLYED